MSNKNIFEENYDYIVFSQLLNLKDEFFTHYDFKLFNKDSLLELFGVNDFYDFDLTESWGSDYELIVQELYTLDLTEKIKDCDLRNFIYEKLRKILCDIYFIKCVFNYDLNQFCISSEIFKDNIDKFNFEEIYYYMVKYGVCTDTIFNKKFFEANGIDTCFNLLIDYFIDNYHNNYWT